MIFARILTALILLVPPALADSSHQFSVGAGAGYSTLVGGAPPWFTVEKSFGALFSTHLKGSWRLGLGLTSFRIFDDSSAHSEFSLGSDEKNRQRVWKGYDITLLFKKRLFPEEGRFSINGGLGGGITVWRMKDAQADTTLKAPGERGETVDLTATEITLTGSAGTEYRFHRNFLLGFDISANYLTGAGLEFDEATEKGLSRWQLRAVVSLSYLLGKGATRLPREEYVEQHVVSQRPLQIKEDLLESPDIASPEAVADSDGDGIPNYGDKCPDTPETARGLVDIWGCSIDTDCDGIPDHLDGCPHGLPGALVDINGCPLDSDNDDVPDGLDDCPGSEPDLPVDRTGCVDLSVLEKPMVLNVKYQSGSFEIDSVTEEKLGKLSRILLKAGAVRVEINGYTDNIGTTQANKVLSQKRANQLKDYLVYLGVDSERLIPVGRGETNFIASNDTRDGRQKNRRIELIFFY